jgi:hypothetical protein
MRAILAVLIGIGMLAIANAPQKKTEERDIKQDEKRPSIH